MLFCVCFVATVWQSAVLLLSSWVRLWLTIPYLCGLDSLWAVVAGTTNSTCLHLILESLRSGRKKGRKPSFRRILFSGARRLATMLSRAIFGGAGPAGAVSTSFTAYSFLRTSGETGLVLSLHVRRRSRSARAYSVRFAKRSLAALLLI